MIDSIKKSLSPFVCNSNRSYNGIWLIIFFVFMTLSACDQKNNRPPNHSNQALLIITIDAKDILKPLVNQAFITIHKGGLETIRKLNRLRVIIPPSSIKNSEQHEILDTYSDELKLIINYAKQQKLQLIFIQSNHNEQNIRLLQQGLADIIIHLPSSDKIHSNINFTLNIDNHSTAWAVRNNNPQLLEHLNHFIKAEKLLNSLPDVQLGDFDQIKQRHELRLITRNNAATYFLWKNQFMGFEYDLIRAFAKQHQLRLKILVAEDNQQMLQWLAQGYGDVIAAGMVKSEHHPQSILYSKAYLFVKEVIVQREYDRPIKHLKDLSGRIFYVQKSSSYWHTLTHLQEILSPEHIYFTVKTVDESMETEQIVKRVISGSYDLTLADSHLIAIEKMWHTNFQTSLSLTKEHGHHWLVNESKPKLLDQLNQFISKEYKGLLYNISYNTYFKNSRNLFNAQKLAQNNAKISKYDDMIKKLSKEYHFDWRLIAAQVNQESQFNPKAISWAGAKGLLQIMPKTAKQVGIENLQNAENGLRAGLKYMTWIGKQLSKDLPSDIHTIFTFAAYNAGLGHLKDARKLAQQLQLDPNQWFGHVEQTFLLLSKPKYYKKAHYGYVRGIETINYVKSIQALFKLYSKKYPNEV